MHQRDETYLIIFFVTFVEFKKKTKNKLTHNPKAIQYNNLNVGQTLNFDVCAKNDTIFKSR